MGHREEPHSVSSPAPPLSNAQIADKLASLAQLLSTCNENPYKVKAYRRAASNIRTLPESLDELVRDEADLTRYAGIGEAIASAIREIVLTGTLGKLEKLRTESSPELGSRAKSSKAEKSKQFSAFEWLSVSTRA